MRIALCFWGLCRSTDVILESYIENVYKPLYLAGYDIDVYVHTYKLYRAYTNFRSNEIKIQLKNTIYKLLKPTKAEIHDQDEIDKTLYLETYRSRGDPWEDDAKTYNEAFGTLNNHIRALWSLKQVTRLWKGSGVTYDYVMYLRPDVKYRTRFNTAWLETLPQKTIYIPDFHIFHGSNDRWAVGRPQEMSLYGNRFDGALDYSRQKQLHAEGFLTEYMSGRGIALRQIPFRFQRVRANGVVCEADKEVF
jgi:hypothetical protein